MKRGQKIELYSPLIEHYIKISKGFAKIEISYIFSKEIQRAHDISAKASQSAYTKALNRFLNGSYNIALDPNGKELDSFEFSTLFKG